MASTRRFVGLGFTAAMIAALLVPVLAGAAPGAAALGDRVGSYDPATSYWQLDGGGTFLYGNPGDAPFMGDWDCDGTDTPGLHRPVDTAQGPAGKVYLRNSNSTGIADVEYFFGDPGDVAFAGDFNGDGCDSVGLFRPSTGQVFLTNLLGSANRGIGAAQVTYDFPAQGHDLTGARALAADFNGDGIDTVALHLPATATVLGVRSAAMTFGDPGDQLVAGAFGGSVDSLGVYRADSFLLSDAPGDVTASAARSLRSAAGSVALSWSASGPTGRSGHVLCNGVAATIVGSDQADVINGSNGADVIAGLKGNDVIGGKGGNDTICGGEGDDVLNGDKGNDTVFGDAGVDNVNGNDGNDTLHGGPGADIITGDKDDDAMFGDGGADNMNGGSGNDTMDGGDGDDLMSGSTGNDTLLGRAGADVLNGGPQFDTCDLGPDGATKSKCENDRPDANPVSVSAEEDGDPVSGTFDATDPDGDDITAFTIVPGSGPSEGSVVNNGDGTFTFNPGADFQDLPEDETRDVTFDYTATDENGAVSDPATVTVTVTGKDDPAFANDDDGGTTDEDTAFTTAGDVTANDGDPDAGEDVNLTGPVNLSSSLGAKVVNNFDGTFDYDPTDNGAIQSLAAGESVEDSIVYTVESTNPASGSASASVSITVDGVNDAPTANAQDVATSGAPITIVLTGADVDSSDDLEFSIVVGSGPSSGILGPVVNSDGTTTDKNTATVTYDPDGSDDFDQFSFQVDDGSATATAVVTINRPDDPDDPNGEPLDQPSLPTEVIIAKSFTVEVTAGSTAKLVLQAAAPVAPQPSPIGDLTFTVDVAGLQGTLTNLTDDTTGSPVRSATVTYDPGAFEGPSTSFTFDACEAPLPSTNCATGTVLVLVAAEPDDVEPSIGPVESKVGAGETGSIDLATGFTTSPEPLDPPSPPGPHSAEPQARTTGTSSPNVYFVIDSTGSMGIELATVRTNVRSAIEVVKAKNPGAQFGLGEYRDFPVPTPNSFAFRHLVDIGDDDGVGGDNLEDVSDILDDIAAGEGGDGAEGQFFALDQLMEANNPAGFDPSQVALVVLIGDNPAHDPVCKEISGLMYDIDEASVEAKLLAPAWSTNGGVTLIADSRTQNTFVRPGLDANPIAVDPFIGSRSANYVGKCSTINGTAGQATRLTTATGGSFLVNADADQFGSAIADAIPAPPVGFAFTVETLPALGTLLDSNQSAVVAGATLPSSLLTFDATGLVTGQKTSFTYKVTNLATGKFSTETAFVVVGLPSDCEVDEAQCDDGRP